MSAVYCEILVRLLAYLKEDKVMTRKFYFAVWLTFLIAGLAVAAAHSDKTEGGEINGNRHESVFPQTFPPGIMYSTLLDNVNLLARDGSFRLGNKMQNIFMPDGKTGTAVVSKSDGKTVFYWDWKLDTFGLKPPYKLFGFQQALNADGSRVEYPQIKLTEPGAYKIDFLIGEKKFYTMPFSVRILESADPFDGNKRYLFDGPWNDWGYLYYADADPSQNLVWKIWMREASFKQPRHKVSVDVVRDKDKKLICQSRQNTSKSFRNEWVRHSFDLVNPPVKTSGGGYFKAQDLLSVDGGYTLTIKIDGVQYGVWKFNITGGKPAYTGQTVRGIADPLTFVEGGKDAFWYKRVP